MCIATWLAFARSAMVCGAAGRDVRRAADGRGSGAVAAEGHRQALGGGEPDGQPAALGASGRQLDLMDTEPRAGKARVLDHAEAGERQAGCRCARRVSEMGLRGRQEVAGSDAATGC
jgi:hypothetical protein